MAGWIVESTARSSCSLALPLGRRELRVTDDFAGEDYYFTRTDLGPGATQRAFRKEYELNDLSPDT